MLVTCLFALLLAQVAIAPHSASEPPADPAARLRWWFEQSKYRPEDSGRYPIVRVWEKNW